MSAATSARALTAQLGAYAVPQGFSWPVDDNVVGLKGTIGVIVSATGYLKMGVTGTGLVCAGRIDADWDNTGTGHAAGAINVPVSQGVFPWYMGTSSDAITNLDIGSLCYIIDNQTVGKTDGGGTRSVAGVICGLAPVPTATAYQQVYVQMGIYVNQAVNPTGAVTLSGAQTLTGTKTFGAGALASGSTAFDLSGMTGAFATPTSASNFFTWNQRQAAGATTNAIADVGTAAALPVTSSYFMPITTAAAETNTLAIPTFVGQRIALCMIVRAVGDRVITSAQAINQAGNTIMTFGAVGDFIVLEGISYTGGVLRWRVVANDGVALS